MTNLNLCARDRHGYCPKCDANLPYGGLCHELRNEYASFDADSGDYNWDGPENLEEALDHLKR